MEEVKVVEVVTVVEVEIVEVVEAVEAAATVVVVVVAVVVYSSSSGSRSSATNILEKTNTWQLAYTVSDMVTRFVSMKLNVQQFDYHSGGTKLAS